MKAALSSSAFVAERTRRRVNRRLMPFIFLLYIVSYLYRVNVGFAGLQMTRELGFSDAVFGFSWAWRRPDLCLEFWFTSATGTGRRIAGGPSPCFLRGFPRLKFWAGR